MPASLTVARRITERLPDVPEAALHNLLYLCQGHYVAAYLQPLFDEGIAPVSAGAYVVTLANHPRAGSAESSLSPAQRASIDATVDRYGHLATTDLAALVCATEPWVEARGGGWFMAPEVIRDYFIGAAGAAIGPDLT
jgi:uncharacterized phage-associated protein